MKEVVSHEVNKGWFVVARNLVKLVKVGTGCRRVGQAVLRAGHTIWALVRWESGIACGQVYTVCASVDQTKYESGKTNYKAWQVWEKVKGSSCLPYTG